MKKILIALSGGVDSSVAAGMITKEYEAVGATMKLYCSNETDLKDAEKICNKIGIPFHLLDFEEHFKNSVIKDFIDTYENGGTPNPCIVCNKIMKFGKLLEAAEKFGCDGIATGHYVNIEYKDGRYCLKKATDLSKDQSYVLYGLTQEQLSKTIFPLGSMTKENARKLADNLHFDNAQKKESQDICFVPDGDYFKFIENYTGKTFKKGYFKDKKRNILGTHQGIIKYTIGQRKGLGLALPQPMYVCEKNVDTNEVILCTNEELFEKEVSVCNFNWVSIENPNKEFKASAKIRYNMKEQPCTVYPLSDDKIKIVFDEPQRAITKGQSAVVYDKDYVIGGGIID
ncbi:MAG: tRNA 2-thiouridine(34) synthase MnmA [Eubacterium sp.]|nr:tRNA 2-thiouridine(34) synthase MnmA [Eubacterium sp.]